ncbi:MAG: hypothetical protein ACRC5M_06800 [Anaeroplasmataceae bacterium]
MPKPKKQKIQYFKTCLKNVLVEFENYFDDQSASDYDEFFMSIACKKTYSRIADMIVKSNNTVLNIDHELSDIFITTYFTIKYSIDRGEYENKRPETFINDLVSLLFPVNFVDVLIKYVDKHYNTNIDENMDLDSHRYDKGTTFLDRHYKVLYLISTMSRLVIPMVTHYIYNKKNMEDINGFIMNVFMALFKLAQAGTDMEIYSKLHLFVHRAVSRTQFTDAIMWDRMRILGITPENVIEDTINKLITNVIPKYDFAQNIMNLNTVVIRKSVMSYTLRKKDPYTLFSLSSNEGKSNDEDSILTEVEIFDSYNTQRDESVLIFRKYGTSRDISVIIAREGIDVTQEEIDFYKKSKRYHDLQKTAIYYVFSRYFSGIENIIGGCKKEDWIRLIIVLKKMLDRVGLSYLSEFISAEKIEFSYKRLSKNIDNTINEDPLYKEIKEKKYGHVQGMFEKKDYIKSMIISIFNNTYTYNSYNNPMNGQYIIKDEMRIIKEVLSFFKTFVM